MQNVDWGALGALAEIIGSIVSMIGIIYISIQVRDTRRFTRSQVINELEKESRDHRKAFQIVTGSWRSEVTINPQDDDMYEIFECLGWFERMKIMLDQKVIDMQTVNELFGYRFFLLVNNRNVQEHILYPDSESFVTIFILHSDWRKYRRQREEVIFKDDTDLAKFDSTKYQKALNIHTKRRL